MVLIVLIFQDAVTCTQGCISDQETLVKWQELLKKIQTSSETVDDAQQLSFDNYVFSKQLHNEVFCGECKYLYLAQTVVRNMLQDLKHKSRWYFASRLEHVLEQEIFKANIQLKPNVHRWHMLADLLHRLLCER